MKHTVGRLNKFELNLHIKQKGQNAKTNKIQ